MVPDTNTPGNHNKKPESSQTIQTIEKEAKSLRAFLIRFNNDWSLNLAGIIAFNLLLAMLPIAIVLIAILGLFLRVPATLDYVVKEVAGIFPGLTAEQNAIRLAFKELGNETGILLILAILVSLFLGSRLFVALEECFAIIYRVHTRTFIRQNIMAMSMLLLFILLVPIMVFASTLPTFVLSLLNSRLMNALPGSGIIVRAGGVLSGLLVAFILFEAIYLLVPNQHSSVGNSWRGALAAAVTVEIYLEVFPVYTTYLLVGINGTVGFALILLLFFYFFAIILLVGAEINAIFEGIRPIPDYLPTFVSNMAARLNSDLPSADSQPYLAVKPTPRANDVPLTPVQEQRTQSQ
jgi:YihY family inner membrane protein